MKKCIKCGHEVSDIATKCHYCGADQTSGTAQGTGQRTAQKITPKAGKGNYCPRCGNPIVNSGDDFCNTCGYMFKLNGMRYSQTQPNVKPSQGQQTKTQPSTNPDFDPDQTVFTGASNAGGQSARSQGTNGYNPNGYNQNGYNQNVNPNKYNQNPYNGGQQSQGAGSQGQNRYNPNGYNQNGYNQNVNPNKYNQNPYNGGQQGSNGQKPRPNGNNPVNRKFITAQEQVLAGILADKLYLAFCILYTANIALNIFLGFSIFNIFGQIIPIIMCVGFWLMYGKGTEYATGSNIISKVMAFWLIVSLICVGLALIAFEFAAAQFEAGAGTYITIALVMILIGLMVGGYWNALRTTFSKLTQLGRGNQVMVTSSLYPIVLRVIAAIGAVISFIQAIAMRGATNLAMSMLNQYLDQISSQLYYSGYGSEVTGYIQLLKQMLQSAMSYGQNPIVKLVAVAVPIMEVILLCKVRSSTNQVYR